MSAADFHMINNTTVDDSIIRRDFLEIYHQHGVRIDDENRNIKIVLWRKYWLHSSR